MTLSLPDRITLGRRQMTVGFWWVFPAASAGRVSHVPLDPRAEREHVNMFPTLKKIYIAMTYDFGLLISLQVTYQLQFTMFTLMTAVYSFHLLASVPITNSNGMEYAPPFATSLVSFSITTTVVVMWNTWNLDLSVVKYWRHRCLSSVYPATIKMYVFKVFVEYYR